jgi:parallel beta-helix repeat protein
VTRSRFPHALRYAGVLALLGLAAAVGAALFLQGMGVAPRALGPYLERRSSGHNPVIVGAGKWLAQSLTALDRGTPQPYAALLMRIGAQGDGVALPHSGRSVLAASGAEVRAAIAGAQPGDQITLLPGTYRFDRKVAVEQPGSALRPITLRADQPGTVLVEFDTVEGFTVNAPFWTFENLAIRGVCARHSDCEHAFHVVGGAQHFSARNNTITDFNAHFKINGSNGRFPDHGLIEGNTLSNLAVRDTGNPVVPIDLVAASHWTIRRNLISDFIKGGGDRVSYGGFAKGAGSANIFEQNIVWCEQRLRGVPGQRVGLSLGGGATGAPFCRDSRCITEQESSVLQSNLIASCSDDGIYLNSAARSRVAHNTLLDTGGISVRFPVSSADVEGNLVDGAIRSRNDGVVRAVDNRQTPIALLYLGYHPVRRLFSAPETLDFAWAGEAPRRPVVLRLPADLCGAPRAGNARYGAFEDFSACLAPLHAR